MAKDDKANLPAGATLICLAWANFTVLMVLVYRVWRDKLAEWFPRKSERLSTYISDRTRTLCLSYLICLIYFATLQRTSHISSYVILYDFTSQEFELIAANLMLAVFSFIFCFQAWRMRIQYQYYVVIANSDWTKLVDTSLENDISFWIKYKAFLTSETTSGTAMGIFVVFWCIVIGVLHKDFRLVRTLIVSFVMLSSLAVFGLLYKVPENRSGQRFELSLISGCIIILAIISGVASNLVQNLVTVAVINNSILIVYCGIKFYVSFVYIPQLSFQNMMESSMKVPECSPDFPSENGISSSRRRVFEVLSDVEKLSSFMEFCCQNWCAENVLCLLELRQFKRSIRRQMRKDKIHTQHGSFMIAGDIPENSVPKTNFEDESASARMTRQYSLRNASTSSRGTLTRAKSRGTLDMSQQLAEHSELMKQMKEIDNFPKSAFFDESLCSWDLHCSISLGKLGCKSSIVSDKNSTLAEKAGLLCEKYFEYTSQYCVNVSESSRRVILSLVGEHSTVADSLDSIVFLFLFDEAVKDLIDNLNDSLVRFCHK